MAAAQASRLPSIRFRSSHNAYNVSDSNNKQTDTHAPLPTGTHTHTHKKKKKKKKKTPTHTHTLEVEMVNSFQVCCFNTYVKLRETFYQGNYIKKFTVDTPCYPDVKTSPSLSYGWVTTQATLPPLAERRQGAVVKRTVRGRT